MWRVFHMHLNENNEYKTAPELDFDVLFQKPCLCETLVRLHWDEFPSRWSLPALNFMTTFEQTFKVGFFLSCYCASASIEASIEAKQQLPGTWTQPRIKQLQPNCLTLSRVRATAVLRLRRRLAATQEHKHVAKQCRNTSVTSWLLVMSEAYQEEDAAAQLALHLCCCSGAESHSSLGQNNRQAVHLVVWEVIPSKLEAVSYLSHPWGGGARCLCRCCCWCCCCRGGRVPASCHQTNPPPGYTSPCRKWCLQVLLERYCVKFELRTKTTSTSTYFVTFTNIIVIKKAKDWRTLEVPPIRFYLTHIQNTK